MPGTRFRRTELAELAENGPQKKAGERRAKELNDDVARHSTPGKISAQCETERDRWIEVCPGNGAHEKDDRHHHQPGRRDGGRPADCAVAGGVHNRAACTYQNEQERPEQLGEEASPLLFGIVERPPSGILQGEQRLSRPRLVGGGCLTVGHLAHAVKSHFGME